ncbi:histone-lysine N-methyltransferase SETDB1-A-like isoform X1 [Xiphophorus couchianus]|uniref:histone-lysine N-methyltransferase SETDB1-A-like isoform X1 n=2 Tax=Xiphophorus couchianus TaxID=32473 RepID=UPI0010165B2B|nr:histone-lysine N-methyltransferase SETDB1-A-like isoform X1 [Xiphophorus couchianus]
MERKEIEMSKEELQSWIRDEVHKARLSTASTLMKYQLLQSLLERRQTQATRFLKLCQSVVIFENTVKELYSQLGWEYTDLDSDGENDEEPMSCRRTLPFVFVSSGDRIHRPSASRDSTSQSPVSELEEYQEEIVSQKNPGVALGKEAMVVLSKLTNSEISASMPPLSSDSGSDNKENLSSAESSVQWEPDKETSESNCSLSDFSTGSKKKRKMNKNEQKHEKLNSASKRSRMSSPTTRRSMRSTTTIKKPNYKECDVSESSSLSTTSDSDDESSKENAAALRSLSTKLTMRLSGKTIKISQTSATVATKTPGKTTETRAQPSTTNTTSESSKTPSTEPSKTPVSTTEPSKTPVSTTEPSKTPVSTTEPSKTPVSATEMSKTVSAKTVIKTITPPAKTKNSFASQQSSKTTVAPPSVPKREIKVNMNVLARKQHLCWQRGKVAEIITKEGGKVKYKVTFEEKGKILVSGHHLAFDNMPKLEELSIGCRVVVKISNEKVEYKPGIMAELPSRKNRMRFLVYIDDHTPMYIGLPALHLVYRALDNPLDDIPDEIHRDFMKEYLKVWPYPPQTQYKVGQTIKADYEGVMQKCEVTAVDCSLVEVIFESDKHKEWLYRGSLRLEHMVSMRYSMWKKEAAESAKKPL